jgi:pyrimidine-nucleoside phosphorylase
MRTAIAAKRDGQALAERVWAEIVAGYVRGDIAEAQMAALLMSAVLRGLERTEVVGITRAMIESGDTLDFGALETVDKHSTGGVGDTTSLIVVPLLSACGLSVAKLAGRALGHTGGTIDKLEAVPGVRTALDARTFRAHVASHGLAIASNEANLAPADRALYALRDRTATVPSIGLIASSIVSKKIAGGATTIVYDVKCGNGAFMRTHDDARQLAEMLVDMTGAFGRKSVALVTEMDQPLGASIGTGLEAIEARDVLEGRTSPQRLIEACLALTAALVDAHTGLGDGRARAGRALRSGDGRAALGRMLDAQGARVGALEALRPDALQTPVLAIRAGHVANIDCVELGECARELVALGGPFAGIRIVAERGTRVGDRDAVATIVGQTNAAIETRVRAAFDIRDERPEELPLVYSTTR